MFISLGAQHDRIVDTYTVHSMSVILGLFTMTDYH